MSKMKKDWNIGSSDQGRLFDSEIVEGALDVSMAFRASLTKHITKSKKSRWQIAAMISELSGHNISKDMLDKYTSGNLDYGLRAEALPATLMSVGSLEPGRILFEPLSCDLVDPLESELVRLARLEQENSKLQGEIAALRHKLGIRK
jgi:hypothetical protein